MMVLHELGPLLMVSGVRVGPWLVFCGAVKGRRTAQGYVLRLEQEASVSLASLQWRSPAQLLGTKVAAARILLEVVSKGSRPDVAAVMCPQVGSEVARCSCSGAALPVGPCPEPPGVRGV